MELENPGGPLGIHVMPKSDVDGRLVSHYADYKINTRSI